MTLQYVPEALPIVLAAGISAALALLAFRQRAMPMARSFTAMIAGEAVWALGAALEPLVIELPIKRLCIDIRLVGTLAAILGLLAFVLIYTGRLRWLRPARFGSICAVAVPLLVLAWTDPWHHLYFTSFEPRSIAGTSIALRTLGPGFWAMFVYCYALVG